MNKLSKILLAALVVCMGSLFAFEYAGHPTVYISNTHSAEEIEKLQSYLSKRGVELEISKVKVNGNEICEIAGSVAYSPYSKAGFDNNNFSGLTIKGGFFHIDVSFHQLNGLSTE